MGGRGASYKGKGSRTIKPLFRKNTANEFERIYNEQSKVVAEIQKLERGMPIAISKAKTEMEKLEIRRKYNKKIAEKRKQASELGRKIGL